MKLLRFVKRAALLIALSAGILVAGVSVYLRIEQYRFRRQAERLLSDVRELELEKASAAQVKVVVSRKVGIGYGTVRLRLRNAPSGKGI
jgi:hypothetical protein